jgi:hypothetical protein
MTEIGIFLRLIQRAVNLKKRDKLEKFKISPSKDIMKKLRNQATV